jgi:hypothetical protein
MSRAQILSDGIDKNHYKAAVLVFSFPLFLFYDSVFTPNSMKPKTPAKNPRSGRTGRQHSQRKGRRKTPKDTERDVLTASRRRCCICSGLRRDYSVKKGQIAHLDHDPNNNDPDNFAFFCLDDHDEYDSRTSQSKGFTIEEIARSEPPSGMDRAEWRAKIANWRRMITLAERKYKSGRDPGISFAEIFQRQPDYVELEPYLSDNAKAALKDDRLGKNPKVIGMVDGKEFVNPPDELRSVLAHELRRIEQLID